MADEKSATIQFIENHLPGLKDGDYTIEVEHTFQVDGEEEETYTATKDFYVAGDRFTTKPEEILAVYPPSNGQADYTRQPPYMALNRNTLPWERNVEPTDEYTPWLGLLTFTEDEVAQITASTVTWADIKDATTDPAFPGLEEEGGTSDSELVPVIDVPVELLTPQLSSPTDLSFLASARTSENAALGYEVERAYLMSKRLPVDGKQHTVYLVSFESRYINGKFPIGDEKQVRLISLYSWNFKSTITYKVSGPILDQVVAKFSDISGKLDSLTGKVYNDTASFLSDLSSVLTKDELNTYETELLTDFNYGNHITILKHANRSPSTLRLPDIEDQEPEDFQLKGYTLIPHKMREGSQSVAFYRGPFIPYKSEDTPLTYPIMASDQVLRYYQNLGMFDISYSSAWEMGRLITLEQTDISTALYQWKRGHVHSQKGQQQVADNNTAHLPGALNANAVPPIPENVSNWFDELEILQNVPFSYLVPDEKLLPPESIRFFYVDNNWLDALIDGALSIGRTTTDDHKNDQEISNLITKAEQTVYSGVLIRSEVVASWPDMLIDGYSYAPKSGEEMDPISSDSKLEAARIEKLSPNIMLCIYKGELATVEMYGKPEAPNFGVEDNADSSGFQKRLKDTVGIEIEDNAFVVDIPVNENSMIEVDNFVSSLSDLNKTQPDTFLWSDDPTSAEFSVQMLEGGQKIRFIGG